jgi:phytoene dehydrogenase-like protein
VTAGGPRDTWDAVVVGAGPNGLAAALTLTGAGRSVLVVEAADVVGGGARTEELTLPGFRHDVCSAVHPTGAASPFFRTLPLEEHGLRWLHPEVPLAHPLDGGRATGLLHDIGATAELLGSAADARAYRRLATPLVRRWHRLLEGVLAPLVPPRHPLLMARFGRAGMRSAQGLARRFEGDAGRALLAGVAAHAATRLDTPFTAGLALVLGLSAHVDGWPVAEGGSQSIADALAGLLVARGGEIRTGWRVHDLGELPPARAVVLDVTPRQFVALAGDRLAGRGRRAFTRFRYGPGTCKVDWALDGPVPWTAELPRHAGTVHVGGTLLELATSEAAAVEGELCDRPFVLLAQPSLVDPTRAPEGRAVLWGYCHVPHGSPADRADVIEAQIERFAPGFRDRVLARSVLTAPQLEAHDANEVGGDVGAGALDGWQVVFRPRPSLHPYRTPVPGVWLCSASTPPGAGVHGMCGHHAALDVLAHADGRG